MKVLQGAPGGRCSEKWTPDAAGNLQCRTNGAMVQTFNVKSVNPVPERRERVRDERLVSVLLRNQRYLVDLCRSRADTFPLLGYVCAVGAELILLHKVEMNSFSLGGYAVIRERDVTRYRVLRPDNSWQGRAAIARGLSPKAFPIDLTNWISVLSCATESFQLVGVELEIRRPERLYIGAVETLTPSVIELRYLDPNGEWERTKRLPLGDITRVSFGGGYIEALRSGMAVHQRRALRQLVRRLRCETD